MKNKKQTEYTSIDIKEILTGEWILEAHTIDFNTPEMKEKI
jgi:hypothetical protein